MIIDKEIKNILDLMEVITWLGSLAAPLHHRSGSFSAIPGHHEGVTNGGQIDQRTGLVAGTTGKRSADTCLMKHPTTQTANDHR